MTASAYAKNPVGRLSRAVFGECSCENDGSGEPSYDLCEAGGVRSTNAMPMGGSAMTRVLFAATLLFVPLTPALGQEPAGEAKYEETLQKLVDIMTQMSKTLDMIVDEDTAKSNRSALRVQSEAFLAARKQSQDYAPPTAEAREKLAQKFRPQFEKLRKVVVGHIARVQRVPGGNASLQEIRSVFEKSGP